MAIPVITPLFKYLHVSKNKYYKSKYELSTGAITDVPWKVPEIKICMT